VAAPPVPHTLRHVVRMSRLVSLQGVFRANVVAARLGVEGFDVELRGALDAPYGLTVGDLARVDVYVPGDQIEAASLVLLADEVDEVEVRLDDDGLPTASRYRTRGRVAAALVLFVVVAGPIAQVLRWY